MTFMVVFNTEGAAVDPNLPMQSTQKVAAHVELLGRGRQVAFVEYQNGRTLSSEDLTHRVALSGSFWLIGRVRLDAREVIRSMLSGLPSTASDALICLHAYMHWGDRCVEYLRGDFCFVVWDARRQRLFCARDQIGVRPLFYANLKKTWLISDSLELLARDRSISDELDEHWIADFLVFGYPYDMDTTVYKQIRRVAPAHFLSISADGPVIEQYWKLEIGEPLYYSDPRQYIEHFQQVLTLAIKDRLPKDRVGISMSGGLDSSTLAAKAVEITGDPTRVIAHTFYFEYLVPHEEKHFSSLVARKLGISLRLRAIDEHRYDPRWYDRGLRTAEPNRAIIQAAPQGIIAAEMAKGAEVWFWGGGPDNALIFEWQAYLLWLAKRSWLRFSAAAIQYIRSKQVREWLATIANYTMHPHASETNSLLHLPDWINPDFVKDLQLDARAKQEAESAKTKHPWHPRAIASCTSALWPASLEQFDSSLSGTPLCWRHPYLDLRVSSFLLSVPPIPWARRKRLIRKAMEGILPTEVLSRDKAGVRNPEGPLLEKYGLPPLSRDGPILRYIDHTKVPTTWPHAKTTELLVNVFVLDYWLRSSHARGTSL
jgi:asparagine synthase (glutamine-hydrolysing)